MGRRKEFVRRRYGVILGYVGLLWATAAVAIAATPLITLAYPDEVGSVGTYLVTALVLGGLGVLLWKRSRGDRGLRGLPEGAVVMTVGWAGTILASVPILILEAGLSPVQALFEATSGWTTTGLSVVDVGGASHLTLFFRSVMELVGGAGFAVLMVTTFTSSAGPGLTSAEGRGDLLVPHLRGSARLVVGLYALYAGLGTLGLWAAGMGAFDAVNHAFAAISTGGFSTRAESIGYWDSALVEGVTSVLMVLGTTNFVVAWHLARGRWRQVWGNGETRFFIAMMVVLVLVLSTTGAGPFRVALFETLSALSTSGFSTVGYADWSGAAVGVLMVAMVIGGGAGSTAGGIKQYRVYAILRLLAFEVKRLALPSRSFSAPTVLRNGQHERLATDAVRTILLFVCVYGLTWAGGTLLIAMHGFALDDAAFEAASALGTVGLSIGVTSADAPASLLGTLVSLMFLGRLETFTVLAAFAKVAMDGRAALRSKGPSLADTAAGERSRTPSA